MEVTQTSTEMIAIPKSEYVRLKSKAKVDKTLVQKILRSLEDIRHGRVSEWKPKQAQAS